MIRRRGLNLFGLFALVPLMLSVPAAASGRVLHLPVCSGDGVVRTVDVPEGGREAPEKGDQCCPKGCHAGCSRKRAAGEIEPSQ